jgi:integrase
MSAKPAVPGDGSIFPYKGKWAAFVWVITPSGEKARKWMYGEKREDIEPAWNELKVQAAKAPIPTSTPTVGEYLTYWLKEVIKPNREDNTYSVHELSSRLYIIPGIGKKKLDPKSLTVRVAQTWLNKIADTCQCCAQGKDAKRKVPRCCATSECCGDYPSRRVIEGVRNTLRAALNNAMREELISRNVATLVTLPKARKRSKRGSSWTVGEARKFLRSARNDNDTLYPLWVLMLVLGIRRGEALGLIWESIDETALQIGLEWQIVHVHGYPITHKERLKTDGSTDTMPLPSICIPALQIARQIQGQAHTDEWPRKCVCGESHKLVFTTSNGTPIEPRNLRRSFDRRCRLADVRQIRLHDTRRTCGSLLRELGVHPRTAMQILRHSRIALTMEIYTEVPDQATRDALGKLSDWLDQAADDGAADGDGERPEATES